MCMLLQQNKISKHTTNIKERRWNMEKMMEHTNEYNTKHLIDIKQHEYQ